MSNIYSFVCLRAEELVFREEMRQTICFYKIFSSLLNVFLLISLSLITSRILWVEANDDMKDDQNWNTIFTLRSDDDWRQLWHSEKHKRCYQDLVNHMEWVCDKDIYKIRSKRHLIEGIFEFISIHVIQF